MKTKIENGIEYILKNDIWYPNLQLKEESIQQGKYGKIRFDYLKHYKKNLYNSLMAKGELFSDCKKVENRAIKMFDLEYERAKDIGYTNVQAEMYAKEIVLKLVIFD